MKTHRFEDLAIKALGRERHEQILKEVAQEVRAERAVKVICADCASVVGQIQLCQAHLKSTALVEMPPYQRAYLLEYEWSEAVKNGTAHPPVLDFLSDAISAAVVVGASDYRAIAAQLAKALELYEEDDDGSNGECPHEFSRAADCRRCRDEITRPALSAYRELV